MDEIDTSNKFLVAAQGDDIVLMRPLARVSKKDALNLAAYLVALSEQPCEDFIKVYDAVCNT